MDIRIIKNSTVFLFVYLILSSFFLIKPNSVRAQSACQGIVKCMGYDPIYRVCTSEQLSGDGCGTGSGSQTACSDLGQKLEGNCSNGCSVGGCTWNPLFLPTPTPAPGGCTAGPWANVSCGGGGCSGTQMQQTRTVNPSGCTSTSRCIADASCNPATPPPGCTVGVWVNTVCGGGICSADQMQQTRTVSPAGCASNSQCVANPGCAAGIPTPTPAPTCTISLSPATLNLTIGGATGTITATVSCSIAIDNVTFTSNNTTIATVSPGTDTTSPFTTTITAVGSGATTITGVVNSGGQPRASDTTAVNSTPPAAWWQVKDSDVATGGDMSVDLPSGFDFDTNGGGGFPGIPSYGGSTNLTNSNVSTTGWLAKNISTNPKQYDYAALAGQIPPEITSTINTINAGDNVATKLNSGTATHDADNYYWFKYDGAVNGGQPLTLSTVNLGSRKAILLVKDANLNITGNVTLTNGSGFFMTVVGGNITVSNAVGGGGSPNLEGIYEADGTFSDSVDNSKLWIRGSIVAYGGVNFQRDLAAGNVTDPAEFFEYGPDQILLYPITLGARRINWKEVAP